MKQRLNAWAANMAAALTPPAPLPPDHSRWPQNAESVFPALPAEAPSSGASRHYGPHDPVVDALRFIWPCPCGHRPVLSFDVPEEAQSRAAGGVPLQAAARHFIHCEACDRKGRPGEMPWEAVVEWNRAYPDTRVPMAEFPFFELSGLPLREARSKLLGVRADLETRRARAKMKARAGQEVGKRYRERIDAYLRWTIVAQALASAHGRAQQREDAERQAASRGHLVLKP